MSIVPSSRFAPYAGPDAAALGGSGSAPATAWGTAEPAYSSLAVTGFIMSFLPFLSVPAIVCCLLALSRTGTDRLRGRGLAVAGVALACVGMLVWVVVLAAVAIPVFLAQQGAAATP